MLLLLLAPPLLADSSNGTSPVVVPDKDSGCHRPTCQFARENCLFEGEFNYIAGRACGRAPVGVWYLGMLLWVTVLIYWLGTTADQYFCALLESLVSFLNLPHSVAGVTLLAFGNGAADVFSSIAAFTNQTVETEGIGIGALLGSGIFVSVCVMGIIAVTSGPVALQRATFSRDTGMYMVSICLLLVCYLLGRIHLYEAVAFFVMYVAYVSFVVHQHLDRRRRRKRGEKIAAMPGERDLGDNLLEDGDGGVIFAATGEDGVDVDIVEVGGKGAPTPHELRSCARRNLWDSAVVWFVLWRARVLEMGPVGRVIEIVQLPLTVARASTIPFSDDERYNHTMLVVSPCMFPLLAWLAVPSMHTSMAGHLPTPALLFIFGLATSALLFFFAPVAQATAKRPWLLLLMVIGFLSSIFWIFVIAKELVGALSALGIQAGISSAFLGSTILAWGTGVGDLVSNVVLARAGKPELSATSCVSGPTFNTLVGAGLSLIIVTAREYPRPFLLERAENVSLTFASLIIGLVTLSALVFKSKFKLSRYTGMVLIGIYAAFLISIVIIEATVGRKKGRTK